MTTEQRNIALIGSIALVVLIGGSFLLRKRGRLYFSKLTKDLKKWNEAKIETLHPKIRDNVRHFIQLAENKGIKLRISEGIRSKADQLVAYNAGYSQVTFSPHMVGLAVDVYPVKEFNYNSDLNNYPNLEIIKEAGLKAGFERVGDWDRPHYQMTFGYEYSDLEKKALNKEFDKEGYLKL